MSTDYEEFGRTRQKARTRSQLIAAARALIAAGTASPTVEQAAEAASVSRTTAYRYFPSQKALLIAAHPEIQTSSLLPDEPGDDPVIRLALAIEKFVDLVLESEGQQRTMLRLSLEADPDERAGLPLRQGRAISWIEEALSPLGDQLSDHDIHQLVLAIRSVVGIEALAWLTDVARLSREEAVGLMRWSAQALLHAALNGGPPDAAGGTHDNPVER